MTSVLAVKKKETLKLDRPLLISSGRFYKRELGNIDDAIELLRKGSEATGNQTIGVKLNELLTNRAIETAHQHLDNKEYEAAIEQFKLAIELDSKCTNASADALTGLDKTDEAIEYLQLGFEKTGDEKFEEKIKELSVTRSLELAEKYMLA